MANKSSKNTKKIKTGAEAKKVSGAREFSRGQRAWRIIVALLAPLSLGIISSLLTMNAMDAFGALNQPPFVALLNAAIAVLN